MPLVYHNTPAALLDRFSISIHHQFTATLIQSRLKLSYKPERRQHTTRFLEAYSNYFRELDPFACKVSKESQQRCVKPWNRSCSACSPLSRLRETMLLRSNADWDALLSNGSIEGSKALPREVTGQFEGGLLLADRSPVIVLYTKRESIY